MPRRDCGDDCDLQHCRQCGDHFEGQGGVCEECIINNSSAVSERLTVLHGGNYEELNRIQGW
jgi:predicted amidophosphoribosyltransferase